jgi:hypothetical protein
MSYKQYQRPLAISDVKPELSLCYAILERAVIDAIGNHKTIEECLTNEARRWINEPIYDYKRDWSFAWICDQLFLDAETVQANIMEFVKTQHQKVGLVQHRSVISSVIDNIPAVGDYNFYYLEDYYDAEYPDKPLKKSNT